MTTGTTATMANAIDVLKERGLYYQVSDEAGLRTAFEKGMVTVYCGYDPTDSSLTHGNLVTIMMLAHLQRAGHKPIALVGGGTGMIGDPGDKDKSRPVLTVETIDFNVSCIRRQLEHYLDFDEAKPNHALLVDNAEWLRSVGFIEFLRDVGKNFRINQMINLEFVRRRLDQHLGMTFLEFSYILLQSYDYLELYRRYGCTLQVGGQDQWANILGGADLVKEIEEGKAYALVAPLITDSAGRKVSKSDGTAIYLDPKRTSPYQFYQFFLNCADADVEKYLRVYTFLPVTEIERLAALQDEDIRIAKEVLAFEATTITHGEEEARKAQETSRSLFRGEAGPVDAMPSSSVPDGELAEGIALDDLVVRVGFFKSKREAKSRIEGGGVQVNGVPITDPRFRVSSADLTDGGVLLRTGKRFHRVVTG